MPWTKLVGLATMLTVSSMSLTGCLTTATPISETDLISKRVVCQLFPERTYSRNDTTETRRHIIGDNAAKRSLCGGGQ